MGVLPIKGKRVEEESRIKLLQRSPLRAVSESSHSRLFFCTYPYLHSLLIENEMHDSSNSAGFNLRFSFNSSLIKSICYTI